MADTSASVGAPHAPAPRETKWAAAHKKLAAMLATAAVVVGLATGVLTLRDQLFASSDKPADQASPSAVHSDELTRQSALATASEKLAAPGLTAATVAELSDDVQLSSYVQLLGPALSVERLQNDEWSVSRWESLDIAVSAFSNRDSQVVAYTLTSLGPGYTPLIEYLRGGIRLRASTFSEIPDDPTSHAGVYPPNGNFSYEEFHLGGGATQGKSVVLAANSLANADDAAATELLSLSDCLPFSSFEEGRGCPLDRLGSLRGGLHVTSMTVGQRSALEALANDGALFFPNP